MIEQPRQFGGGKIGVEQQPGAFADHRLVPCGAQGGAGVGGAAVLPDNRVVDRLTGVTVPHNGGFALVGDADGGDVGGLDARLGDGAAHNGNDRGPYLLRIMFHPA